MAGFTAVAMGIAAAASVAGAGISAYGQVQAGKSAKRAAEFNAKQRELDAAGAELESREATRRLRDRNEKLLSRQRARIGKSGVIEEGSPLLLMAEDAGMLELEALDARRASLIEQTQMDQAGQMAIFQGENAATAGKIGAGASLISGAAQGFGYAGQASLYGGGPKNVSLSGGGTGTVVPGANYSIYTPPPKG
jgi:hypothetical protein